MCCLYRSGETIDVKSREEKKEMDALFGLGFGEIFPAVFTWI